MSKGYWITLIFMWSLEIKEKGVVKKRRILCRIMKKRRKVGGRTLDFSGLWISWGMQLNYEEQLIKIRFSHLLPDMSMLKVGMCTTNVSMMTLRFLNKVDKYCARTLFVIVITHLLLMSSLRKPNPANPLAWKENSLGLYTTLFS